MQPARLAPRLAAGVLALVVALATAGCARTAAAGTARITVLQPDGTPAVHVHVGVDDRADPSDRAFTTRTDDGGHAVVRLPRAGTPYLLVAGVAAPERGLAPELPGTVAVYLGARGGPAADPRIPAPFTAAPPGAVTMRLGRSARISGTTEPGRTVELRTSGGRLAGQQRASATGRFAFDVVPGRFRLDVPVDATTRAARSPLITVAPGAARSVDLRSGRNAELAGVVTVDGVPAAGVAVRVVTPDVRAAPADADGALATRTDAAGRYRLAVLSADGGTVVFGGPQRGDGEPAAARTWHLTAAPAGRTITHDADLAPGGGIDGAWSASTTDGGWRATVTDAAGDVVAEAGIGQRPTGVVAASGLAPGTYRVTARADDGRWASAVVVVHAGSVAHAGTLGAAHAGLTVRGTAPALAGGFVDATPVGGAEPVEARVRQDGRFVLGGLVPGAYRLTTGSASRANASAVLHVSRSATASAPVGPEVATLSGRVTLGGEPLAGGMLAYLDPALDVGVTAGRFSLTAAARAVPGTYRDPSFVSDDTAFPADSPFDVVLPRSLTTLVLHPGGNAIGPVDLTVRG